MTQNERHIAWSAYGYMELFPDRALRCATGAANSIEHGWILFGSSSEMATASPAKRGNDASSTQDAQTWMVDLPPSARERDGIGPLRIFRVDRSARDLELRLCPAGTFDFCTTAPHQPLSMSRPLRSTCRPCLTACGGEMIVPVLLLPIVNTIAMQDMARLRAPHTKMRLVIGSIVLFYL